MRHVRFVVSGLAVLALAVIAGAQAPRGLDDIKKQIGATDEEWKVIGPKLQKVMALRQQLTAEARPSMGMGFGFGGPAGRPGSSFQGPGAFMPFGPGPGGPGGPGGAFPAPPQPGQILPQFLQDQLKLSDEQKKQLTDLQKDVDGRLGKLLTAEQNKQLQELGRNIFGPGAGKRPAPFGNPAPGGAPPGAAPNRPEPGPAPSPAKEPAPNRPEPAKESRPEPAKGPAPAAPGGPAKGPAADPGTPPGGPRPGGFGGGVPATGNNALSQAQSDLQAALKDPKHTDKEIQEKVAAVRQARQRARAELDAALKELRLLLTAEQEAVLVGLGYLD